MNNPPHVDLTFNVPIAPYSDEDRDLLNDIRSWKQAYEHVHENGVCIKSRYTCPSQLRPADVFGQTLDVGDYISAAMGFGRSSVLRVGLVVSIGQTNAVERTGFRSNSWNIKVRWTHNGDPTGSFREVKDSSIKWDSTYTYAKFMIIPNDYVSRFPEDITHD